MSVQQQARLRHQADIAGLPLEGGVLQWLIDRDLGAEHVMAYRLVLESDSALSHVHPGAEEVLYILEGTGEARIEGATHQVADGRGRRDGAAHPSRRHSPDGAAPGLVRPAIGPPRRRRGRAFHDG
ncbi:MAG: cupin domain-containing protein [Chloroflexi bacterium]|nr:MAG: cupin domain-containing protein [Chloroflexota bacterium]